MADTVRPQEFDHCPLQGSCSRLNGALNGTKMDLGTAKAEQFEPLFCRQTVAIAVLGDRHAVDVLHREVRPPARGLPLSS